MTIATNSPEQWKEVFTDIVKDALSNGGFQRGELKETTNMVATDYNVSPYTVKNFYYKVIDEITEEVTGHPKGKRTFKSNDQSTKNESMLQEEIQGEKEDKELIRLSDETVSDSIENALNIESTYKVGEMVDVQVTNFKEYGVFVKTLDKKGYGGLIHVTQMTGEYIADINDFFDYGDTLQAKVKSFHNGRLDLSTKGLPLPKLERQSKKDFVMTESSTLAPVRESINESVQEAPETETITTSNSIVKVPVVEKKESNPELKEIMTHLNTLVGILSPAAQSKLEEMITEMGVFRFTMAMSKSTERMDMGLMLLNEIEKKANGGL